MARALLLPYATPKKRGVENLPMLYKTILQVELMTLNQAISVLSSGNTMGLGFLRLPG